MALPLLVGGAECGPINPLQGLSKAFDQDRGLQQDHFSNARAGSSKERFRSQYATSPGVDQDAARFFSSAHSPTQFTGSPAFDMSAMHMSLPPAQSSAMMSPSQQTSAAPWAADFLQQQPGPSQLQNSSIGRPELQAQPQSNVIPASVTQAISPSTIQPGMMQWQPSPMNFMNGLQSMPMQASQSHIQNQTVLHDPSVWDKEFQSQEASLLAEPVDTTVLETAVVKDSTQRQYEADELARTAGHLIETVRNETNPKFKNSQFLGLMKQIRDKEVVVHGNDMVASDWARDFDSTSSADIKGKGKARDLSAIPSSSMSMSSARTMHGLVSQVGVVNAQETTSQQEDANDAYFRQDNEEYARYWNEFQSDQAQSASAVRTDERQDWAKLQRDWDSYEATATGLRPISNYQFQPNNPYLLGDSSRTRHHDMHEGAVSLYESVLEMEAEVQHDPTNARKWFELGVKQQENEREQKAIHALRRALEIDPTHLPSWIALAVSYTNDGNRHGTYDAIREWVDRNERYRAASDAFSMSNAQLDDMTPSERFNRLAECLMAMARSDTSGEIDPDIQIALAVLLNTNEEYEKARDCFTAALAVRPDDWLLYNRVGATLANSGHPEEALQYYYRALELNPAYIRARFNLGISCINLRLFDEASQHILHALVLQDSDSGVLSTPDDKRGVMSNTLWESLKTCCVHMQRIDLATICDQQDLDAFLLNHALA
ncbi:peroxisomal targeting signal receptor family protein [Abortiporus biennis]